VVRLGALYGGGLDKGALYDLLNNDKVYVDINSEYNYIDVDVATKWIIKNLNEIGIKEVGAYDTISLLEISKNVPNNPIFEGRKEIVYSEDIVDGMPSSKDVVDSLLKINLRKEK